MDKDKTIMYAPENSNWRWNPVTKKVEYSPTTPNYVAETFAAQQRQRQVQNSLQWIQDALDNVNASVEDFQQRRRDLGIYTEEEKEAARLAAIERTQEELSDIDWNSEDAEGIYRSFASPEDIRTMEIAKGIGTTVATLPFTAGMTGGWTPGIITTATGAAGGYAGAYGGQKLGQYIDNRFKTNTTPWLTFAGGLFGGALGGGLGYKGWESATNQYLINKAFKSGQLKWGQPTSYTAYHQSATPITKFKFPFKERWDVKLHGADPNGAFFTVGKPAGSGFLAKRPYTGQFQIKVQKPLIQTGELTGPTKNGLRNAIVRKARRNGADAVFFDGIADNQLQNQQILFAMDNANIGYRGMIDTPFKRKLFWDHPKGMRNWDTQMGILRKSNTYADRLRAEELRARHFISNTPGNKLTWEGSNLAWNEAPVQKPRWINRLANENYSDIVPKDTPVTFFHGSIDDFNVFDYSRANGADPHFFFSTDRAYVKKFNKWYRSSDNPTIKKFYLYSKNPQRITQTDILTGSEYPGELAWYPVQENVRKYPHADSFYGPDMGKESILPSPITYPTEIAIPRNTHMKLTDPFVYDDQGFFIKLSKRDNFNNPDIRYNKGGKIENPDH